MVNTVSGLSGFLDRLIDQQDQQRLQNQQLQGLAAGGVAGLTPADAPSSQGVIAKLLGIGNPSPQTVIAAPQAPGPPQIQPDTIPGGPGPGAVTASPLAPPANPNGNLQQALSFYQSKGLSPLAASALVGGFHTESGASLNTRAVSPGDGADGSNSIGIGQWNGPRAQALQQFAAQNRLDPSDINTQLQFSWQELNGPEKATLAALQQAKDPAQATAAALGYERPAGWTAANPYGAKTFGKRLQTTASLFATPFNSAPLGPNPNQLASGMNPSFDPGRPGGPLPGMSSQAIRKEAAARPDLAAPPAYAPKPDAGIYNPATGTFGPSSDVKPYPPSMVPTGSPMPNPGSGVATGGQRSAPTTGSGANPSPIAIAAARASGVMPATAEADPATPSTAPGTAAATSVVAPSVQATAPGAAATQAGFARPTVPQIQALIVNPATRDIGLKLWEQSQTGKNYGFMAGPNGAIVRTDPSGGTAFVVIPGTAKDEGYTLKAGETRFQNGKAVATIADPASDNLFDGKSVEGQSLNHLVKTGQMSPEQAAEFGAGKIVTDPSTGAMTFLTPQHVFRTVQPQQQGGVVPAPTDAASAPTAGATVAPAQNSLIPLTPPRAVKFSEQESNAATFAQRMDEADKIMERPEIASTMLSLGQRGLGAVPIGGNFAVSPEYQQAQQAKKSFINAILRRESGAVINDSEFASANETYIPVPGDKPPVLKQKAEARARAIEGLKNAAGGAYTNLQKAATPEQAAPGAGSAPVSVNSPQDAARLPSGTKIKLPDGRIGTVP